MNPLRFESEQSARTQPQPILPEGPSHKYVFIRFRGGWRLLPTTTIMTTARKIYTTLALTQFTIAPQMINHLIWCHVDVNFLLLQIVGQLLCEPWRTPWGRTTVGSNQTTGYSRVRFFRLISPCIAIKANSHIIRFQIRYEGCWYCSKKFTEIGQTSTWQCICAMSKFTHLRSSIAADGGVGSSILFANKIQINRIWCMFVYCIRPYAAK